MAESFSGGMESGSGSPCGACKFLRRKCAAECVFAPYFRSENGPARFAAIHKVFGASNASKLLLHVPLPDRYDAVLTIAYEAQARICDPVRGCVAHISALQQQVVNLQAELMQMRDQVAAHQWRSSVAAPQFPTMQDCISDYYSSSPNSIDGFNSMQSEIMQYRDEEVMLSQREAKRRRLSHAHLSELQEMALMMMKNGNS